MEYNCHHIIEYNSIDDDDLKDHAYRLDFLKCFNVESYDDTIESKMDNIYNNTKGIKEFIDLYSVINDRYGVSNDDSMSLVYLLSYDFLFMFHKILGHYILSGEVLTDDIDKLVEAIRTKQR